MRHREAHNSKLFVTVGQFGFKVESEVHCIASQHLKEQLWMSCPFFKLFLSWQYSTNVEASVYESPDQMREDREAPRPTDMSHTLLAQNHNVHAQKLCNVYLIGIEMM